MLPVLPVFGLFHAARQAAAWRPQVIGLVGAASTKAISPDGRWLVITEKDNTSVVWDLVARRRVRALGDRQFAFSRDGKHLALVEWEPKGRFYAGVWGNLSESASGQKLRLLQEPAIKGAYIARSDWPQAIIFSPDNREFWVASSRFLRRFDVKSGTLLRKTAWRGLGGDRKTVMAAAFSPDGSRIGLWNGHFSTLHDVQTGKVLGMREHGGSYGELSFDGRLNFERLQPQIIKNAATLQHMWQTNECGTGQFSHDGRFVLCSGKNGLEMHDVLTGEITGRIPGPTSGSFIPSPDGNYLYSINQNQLLRWRTH